MKKLLVVVMTGSLLAIGAGVLGGEDAKDGRVKPITEVLIDQDGIRKEERKAGPGKGVRRWNREYMQIIGARYWGKEKIKRAGKRHRNNLMED